MDTYVLGVDIGSSTLKITFLNAEGKTIGPFRREIQTQSPQAGWVEQMPGDWISLFREILSEAYAATQIRPEQIIAISPDATTHTTILMDENFQSVRPAIMWNDQRSTDIAKQYSRLNSADIFETTNHEPGAMWSLYQNLWVKQFEPEIWRKVSYMLFAKDYFRFILTGEYATDHIDAQGSGFFDVKQNMWSEKLCNIMEFPCNKLPQVKKPTDLAGLVTDKASKMTGLAKGTKVFIGSTDTVMEVLASGTIAIGQSTIKLATSGRVCIITDKAYPNPMLVNYSHVIDGLWYPGTGTRSCASSLRWYKDNFAQYQEMQANEQKGNVYALLDKMAEQITVGSEKLFYHPYLLGEFTPYLDADLRASFIGASYNHTNAHFIRAVMEGCAYSIKDCYATISDLKIPTSGIIRLIGGGSNSNLWSSIVADVIGKSVVRPIISDSSFGSAMVAGIGIGIFADYSSAVKKCVQYEDAILHNERNTEKYNILFQYYKKIQQQLSEIYTELANQTL